MYNPDFWEVRLEPCDLSRFANEAGVWFETEEERLGECLNAQRARDMLPHIMAVAREGLTQRQQQTLLLYFIHDKTQEEIAEILGISRRVVSQHLFGIHRQGKHVGGAVKKLRRLCEARGLGLRAGVHG